MGAKYTEAQARAFEEYEARTFKKSMFRFRLDTDQDIIDSIVILESRAVAVNTTIDALSRAFRFETLDTVSPDALYNEMVPGGISQVLPNDEGVETKVNIEAFFNALHTSRERVISLLSNLK